MGKMPGNAVEKRRRGDFRSTYGSQDYEFTQRAAPNKEGTNRYSLITLFETVARNDDADV